MIAQSRCPPFLMVPVPSSWTWQVLVPFSPLMSTLMTFSLSAGLKWDWWTGPSARVLSERCERYRLPEHVEHADVLDGSFFDFAKLLLSASSRLRELLHSLLPGWCQVFPVVSKPLANCPRYGGAEVPSHCMYSRKGI